MPLFMIYAVATGLVRGVESYPNSPVATADWAFIPVDRVIATGRGDRVVDGVYVPYAPTIADNRTAKVAAAQAIYDGLIAAGFTYGGVAYQIDPDSQTQLAAMGLMALGSITDPANSPWPAGFYWVATDNSHVPMDAPTTYSVGRAVAGYVSACILRLRAIKDEIAAAADQAALDAIDVTAGYPTA
jgi:hypothetical protein